MSTLPILMTLVLSLSTSAEDTVIARTSTGDEVRINGQIIDYDDVQLQIELAGGRKRAIRAEKVLRVETYHEPQQLQADEARAEGRHDAALVLYQKALDLEQRRWVRRAILREMIWSHRALGQIEQAGEMFLVLARDRPGPSDFACMPLSWSAAPPSASLERAARAWIARDDLPAAVLLGASHLLSTSPTAVARLTQLMVEADGPLAQLAAAQLWRAEVVTAGAAQTAAWQGAIDRMPQALQAGPCFVLGQALARQGRFDEAALAMLRSPILYPRDRALAAEALVEAGGALEKLARANQAAWLYREVVETYPSSRAAIEARTRWEAMTKK